VTSHRLASASSRAPKSTNLRRPASRAFFIVRIPPLVNSVRFRRFCAAPPGARLYLDAYPPFPARMRSPSGWAKLLRACGAGASENQISIWLTREEHRRGRRKSNPTLSAKNAERMGHPRGRSTIVLKIKGGTPPRAGKSNPTLSAKNAERMGHPAGALHDSIQRAPSLTPAKRPKIKETLFS
jgi:hypothetical protein